MNKSVSLILSLVLLCSLQACKNIASEKQAELTDENSVKVTDLSGEVRIPLDPQRVVAYSYPILDMLEELGLEDRVIGFSKQNTPDYLSKFKDDSSLKDFGGTKDPNFEKINNANPDLIIMERRVEKDHDELAKIAPTLFIDTDHEDYINSIKNNVNTLGKVFGIEEKAEQKIEELEKAIEDNKADDTSKKGLVVMFNNGKFSAFGPNSRYGFIHDNFEVAPVSKDIEAATHGYNISSEYIQEHNPDIIYVVDKNAAHHEGDINKSGIENKLVQQTNAYKNGKIIYLTPDLWYYGGGGLQGMKKMAEEIGQAFH